MSLRSDESSRVIIVLKITSSRLISHATSVRDKNKRLNNPTTRVGKGQEWGGGGEMSRELDNPN